MGAMHTAVFYDGLQLGNAQNGMVDLGKFSMDDIEEVAVYNGQKSGIFQSAKEYGASGYVYFQPKKPSFRQGKNHHLNFRLRGGSIQLFNPSLRFEKKLTSNLNFSLSSEFLKSDGVYPFRYTRYLSSGALAYDTLAKRQDADIISNRLEMGIFKDFKQGEFRLRGYGYRSFRGLPSAIVNGGFGKKNQRLNEENYFVQSYFKTKIFPKLETQIRAKFAYDYTHYVDTTQAFKVQNHYIQREAYFSSSFLYSPIQKLNFSTAFDFQYNNLDANLVNFIYPERYSMYNSFAINYQGERLKMMASILGSFFHNKTNLDKEFSYKKYFTPSFFVSYAPFDSQDFSIRAFYKNIFRLPTFNDMYYTIIGFRNLRPEFTHQYNIGFLYDKKIKKSGFQNFHLKVDAYYNEVTDKIITAKVNPFLWTTINLGKVKIYGVDMNLNTNIEIGNFKFRPLLNYTYQQAKDFTSEKDSFYGHQIPYVPWHSGGFSLLSEYKNWTLGYSFIYVGERYDLNQNNIAYNYVQPWHTHDFSLHKKIQLPHYQIDISLEVNNILNQYYDVVLNYPMPGRNFRATFSLVW